MSPLGFALFGSLLVPTVCPDRGQVAQALVEVGMPADAGATVTVFVDERAAGTLSIDVSTSSEHAARTIRVSPDCGRRARAVAVVVASSVQRLTAVELAVPATPAVFEPAGAPASRERAEVGLGLFATTEGGGAPGAVAHVASPVRTVAPIVRLGVSGSHHPAIGASGAGWTRAFGSVGLRERFGGAWSVALRQEAIMLATIGSGSGFDANRTGVRLVPALGAAVAFERSWSALRLWIELGAWVTLHDQQLLVERPTSTPARVTLPRSAETLSAGASWTWR
jgi:hypothetical protein